MSNLSDEANQEKTLNDPALVVEKTETTLEPPRDTLVPPPNHGWLEQFEAFGVAAFERLEMTAAQGLVSAESDLLVELAIKLVKLAELHEPDSLRHFLVAFPPKD